jgi:hypothetical protein
MLSPSELCLASGTTTPMHTDRQESICYGEGRLRRVMGNVRPFINIVVIDRIQA